MPAKFILRRNPACLVYKVEYAGLVYKAKSACLVYEASPEGRLGQPFYGWLGSARSSREAVSTAFQFHLRERLEGR